jgi:hypothetical protein
MLDSDAEARAMVSKYNNVRMPDLGLDDQAVADLVDLLSFCSANPCELKGKFTPVTKSTPADVEHGIALFVGTTPLKNGGAACIACHRADGAHNEIAGGTLSKDLTHAFARFGDEGLDAALRNPAFPVMNKVFADHPVTEGEAFALRSFLDDANRGTAVHDRSNVAPLSMPLLGAILAILSLVLMNLVWGKRLAGIRAPLVARNSMTAKENKS